MDKAEVERLSKGHTLCEAMRDFLYHTFNRPKIKQSFLGMNLFFPEFSRNLEIKSKLKCSFSTAGLGKDSGPSILTNKNRETLEAP